MRIVPPSPLDKLLETRLSRLPALISSGIGTQPEDEYPHWSKLRRQTPPKGFSNEDWWLAVKLARAPVRQRLPLADKEENRFSYSDSRYLNRMLSRVDRDAGGRIELPSAGIVNVHSRDRYLVRSLTEEAIRSSQLEGAATTHRVAKEMLRSGRRPRDRGEE